MNVKLFSYWIDDKQVRIGIEIDQVSYNFTQIFEMYKDIKGVFKSPELIFLQMMIELGFFNPDDIDEIVNTVRDLRPLDDLRIDKDFAYDMPISRPTKILCIGRNYTEHAKETGHDAPREPIFFAKMPTALIPNGASIVLPPNVGRVDHELELALVISRQGKNIPPSKALEYIAGYSIVNDVTARAMQKADIAKGHPWMRSKSFDTFCPMGPYLVPTGVIADAQQLELTLKVNGEVRQHSNTANMIFPVPELIAYISKHMTLMPGDIIATGTPEGISELHDGDVIEGEIDGLGVLENKVISG